MNRIHFWWSDPDWLFLSGACDSVKPHTDLQIWEIKSWEGPDVGAKADVDQ